MPKSLSVPSGCIVPEDQLTRGIFDSDFYAILYFDTFIFFGFYLPMSFDILLWLMPLYMSCL